MLEILGRTSKILELDHNIPMFKVTITILFVAITAVLITKILSISNYYLCMAIGAITMSFPSISGILMNQYSAPFNMFALFLMVQGVNCIIHNGSLLFLMGSIIMACSLDIYQAYLPLAISLFLLYSVQMIIIEERCIKVIIKGLKFMGALIMAYITCRNFIYECYGN